MRTTLLALALAPAIALSACNGSTSMNSDPLQNPLYAEYYYDDLVESMVNFQLNDPNAVADDERLQKVLEDVRYQGLKKAQEANKLQDTGAKGMLVQAKAFAQGEALFANNTVYFGPDFLSAPGPSLHVYLSTRVDPRDVEVFPSADDVDLGLMTTPYGTQQYATPELDPVAYRTVVLYDTMLKRVYSFVQLAK